MSQITPRPDAVPINALTMPVSSFQARVMSVSDGDSISVLVKNETLKIRLAEIDAPERRQPWGQQSRQELIGLVSGKTVTVTPHGQDRYGRTIGDITANGGDVNQIMVIRGAAWAYGDYLRDAEMMDFEATARASRVGLWAMPAQQRIPPWEYRIKQRSKSDVAVGR